MLFQTWTEVLSRSFQDVGMGAVAFIPKLFVALVIFIVGWIIGMLLDRVVSQIIHSIRVDSILKSAGFEEILGRMGFKLDAGRFVGELVKWFVIVVFLIATLEVLGLSQVNVFLQTVVLAYIPQVIAAALILIIGAVLADALQKVVIGAARAAQVDSAYLLGGLTRWAIWIFAVLIALSQLGIGDFFAQTLFTGVVVALAIGFGLAFGLGGQSAAGRFVDKLSGEISRRD